MKNYITKIRANISINATRKTSNILDGSYKSIYKGTSMNFEDLREYIPGDNIRDIDWKASSRSRNILVKRYIAEKKHNIMIVFDSGKKLLGDTPSGENKKEVMLMAAGTIGYIAAKNGDNVGAVFGRGDMIDYYQLKNGMYNLERILAAYSDASVSQGGSSLERTLNYILNNIRRSMVIFIVTDRSGIRELSEDILKKLRYQHDVLAVSVADRNLTEKNTYMVESENYLPDFIAGNKKLKEVEAATMKKIDEENEQKLNRHGIVSISLEGEKNLTVKIIELLEKHKYGNNR